MQRRQWYAAAITDHDDNDVFVRDPKIVFKTVFSVSLFL